MNTTAAAHGTVTDARIAHRQSRRGGRTDIKVSVAKRAAGNLIKANRLIRRHRHLFSKSRQRHAWLAGVAPDHVIFNVDQHAEVARSEEHTSELQSLAYLVCRLLLEKKH